MLQDSQARRKLKMARLRKLGISDAEIGRRFGMSREWVGQILGRKNGQRTQKT